MGAVVEIGRATLEAAVGHLRRCLPHEGVGLIGGRPIANGIRLERFYPGTNVDASATRYTMDPAEVIAALADIERRGLCLGAIVHSHPATPPLPSATDRREAYYPDAVVLIVGFGGERVEVRGWRLPMAGTSAEPVEVPLVVRGEGSVIP